MVWRGSRGVGVSTCPKYIGRRKTFKAPVVDEIPEVA